MNNILHTIISNATKAASDHNTQPWKFRSTDYSIYIYPDYQRMKHPNAEQSLFISLGCALENLVVAANHFNLRETIHYNFDLPEEHIRVDLEPHVPANKNDELFNQLEKRQVTRGEYFDTPIPSDHILDLVLSCKDPDIFLKIIVDKKEKKSLMPFIQEAIIRQTEKDNYRKTLEEWVRFNEKEASLKKDGINGELIGLTSSPSWWGKIGLSSFVNPRNRFDKFAKLITSAPVIMMFLALKQDKTTMVKLGRSYERIALKATSLGIKHAHINMVCEDLIVKDKLKQEFGYSIEEPMLMIRMGYAMPSSKSYRRELSDVLVE